MLDASQEFPSPYSMKRAMKIAKPNFERLKKRWWGGWRSTDFSRGQLNDAAFQHTSHFTGSVNACVPERLSRCQILPMRWKREKSVKLLAGDTCVGRISGVSQPILNDKSNEDCKAEL